MLLFSFPIYIIAAPPYITDEDGVEVLNADSKIECAGYTNQEYILVYSEEVFALNKLNSRRDFIDAKIFEIRSKSALAKLLKGVTRVHTIAGIAVDLHSESPTSVIPYSRLRPMLQ